jgi:hypothetical protein
MSAAVGLIGLLGASSASAATQVGETFTPPTNCAPATWLQSGSPGGQYAAPFVGVLTSWSFQAGPTPPPIKLKVARHTGGNSFTIVGESDRMTLASNLLNTYPVQIPVQAGDVLGFTNFAGRECARAAPGPGYSGHAIEADPAPGSTPAFEGPIPGIQLDISATLEPDCDSDGFGDETQDGDLLACDTTAPGATITKGPKNKTKKKKAKFEFTGSDARAVAGFQCSLDGDPFEPCTSPHKVKVKKGKHTFEVRAVDDAGNVGSPASDRWKRKKKRKK